MDDLVVAALDPTVRDSHCDGRPHASIKVTVPHLPRLCCHNQRQIEQKPEVRTGCGSCRQHNCLSVSPRPAPTSRQPADECAPRCIWAIRVKYIRSHTTKRQRNHCDRGPVHEALVHLVLRGNSPTVRHPRVGGGSSSHITWEKNWIPACAGMTSLFRAHLLIPTCAPPSAS